MKPANDMLEIAKGVNLNKLDKTLNKVMRRIQEQAKKGHTGVSLPKRFVGENEQLREILTAELRESGYKVTVWYHDPFVWISWR